MAFKKATKFASKARIAISGPAGAGKTYTSLLFAFGLAENGKVAIIDTERGSASKYADDFPEFDVQELESFHPNEYIKYIHEAEQGGYDVLIIDSLSHAWNGQGGVLEIVEATAKRSQSKNTFNAWSEGTKVQNALIDAIVRSKLHIIVTMRSKTEYVIEQVNGKNTPRKVGMAPVQRADLEYEFDCFFEMDYSNTLIVQKSRCSALANQVIEKPDRQVAEVLKAWLQGAPMPEREHGSEDEPAITEQQVTSIRKLCQHLGKNEPNLLNALSYLAAKQLIQQLTVEYRESRQNGAGKPVQSLPAIVSSDRLNAIYARGRALGYLYKDIKEFSNFVMIELHLDAPIFPKDMTIEQANDIESRIAACERQSEQAS